MRVRAGRALRSPWLASLGLSALVCSSALSPSVPSGAAVPLVLAAVVLAGLLVPLATPSAEVPDLAPHLTAGAVRFEMRSPARQYDPDAAGHARPRAPGRRARLSRS